MNWNKWIRQGHRWLSMAFALIVVAIFAALALGEPAEWVYFLPLPLPLPLLALLLLTGLYLFALPYAAKWRSGRATSG